MRSLFLLIAAFSMGLSTKAPAKPLEITGWLVHWDGGDSIKAFEANAKLIARVAPGWYDIGDDGMPRRLSSEVVKPEDKARVLAIAKANGVKVLGLAANYNSAKGDFDAELAHKFLADPALSKKHAEALAELARQDGADGLDVDYESMKGSDREAYSRFMEMCAAACKARGLLLATAVHPKLEEPGGWDGAISQDWKRLGAAVDFFRPMAYDNHWVTSEAGPIAPPQWTADVLKFALSLVPSSKIELGVPAYGYDWLGKKGDGLHWKGFQELQAKQGRAKRDRATGEWTMKYAGREVWFADSQSMKPKYALARKAGIRGFGLWRLGSEDPDFWKLFSDLR